jgi:hypothetical protein
VHFPHQVWDPAVVIRTFSSAKRLRFTPWLEITLPLFERANSSQVWLLKRLPLVGLNVQLKTRMPHMREEFRNG